MRHNAFRFAALALLLAGSRAFAQDFSGSLESGVGWWLQSSDIRPSSQRFEGRIEGSVGDPTAPSAQYSAQVRFSYDPATTLTQLALREAWVKAFIGPFDLSVGNQIVAWGCSDVFTPVDVVNPQDLSLPAEMEKMPVPMGRLVLNGSGFSLDLVALPYWTAGVLPAARWQSSSLPPGVIVDSQSVVTNSPAATWENLQYGGRLSATLGVLQGFDLGLSFFRGINTTPTATNAVTVASPGHVTVLVTKNYSRYSLAGFDAALAFDGGFLLKAEGSYKVPDGNSWIDPAPGSATAQGVAGGEYTIAGVKTIGEFVLDWAKGAAGSNDTWTKTMVLILSAEAGSRLSLKAVGAWNLDGSGIVSPQASYTLADGLEAELKAFVFLGDAGTRYGAWKDNALGKLSLKYSF